MNLNCDHVNDGGPTVSGIIDAVAANSESCVIWISLFRSVIYTDWAMLICDVLLPCDGYIIRSNENNCVGTWALAWDALSKATKFSCVGLSPEFLVFGVGDEVPHFHEGTCLGVEDSVQDYGQNNQVCHCLCCRS